MQGSGIGQQRSQPSSLAATASPREEPELGPSPAPPHSPVGAGPEAARDASPSPSPAAAAAAAATALHQVTLDGPHPGTSLVSPLFLTHSFLLAFSHPWDQSHTHPPHPLPPPFSQGQTAPERGGAVATGAAVVPSPSPAVAPAAAAAAAAQRLQAAQMKQHQQQQQQQQGGPHTAGTWQSQSGASGALTQQQLQQQGMSSVRVHGTPLVFPRLILATPLFTDWQPPLSQLRTPPPGAPPPLYLRRWPGDGGR